MARILIKKNKDRVLFDPDKVRESIRKAALSAGLSEKEARDLVIKVAAITIAFADTEDIVTTKQIRDIIVGELEKLNPKVAQAWKDYEKNKPKKEK